MLWRDTHPALHSIALVTIGFMLYSFADTIVKWLTQFYSVPEILTYHSLLALPVGVIWLVKSKGWAGFKTPCWRWMFLRGFILSMTTICIVNAVSYIPLADVYSIIFIAPLLISILSSLLFKEKVGFHRFMALIVGFIGVLIVAGPQFEHFNIGIIFAFLCAFLITANLLLLRVIGDKEPLPLYFLYPFSFTLLFNAPFIMNDYTAVATEHWIFFIILTLCVVTAMVITSLGFARAPESSVVAPFHYTQIFWGILLGILIFGDIPTLQMLGGVTLIIASGLYTIWREHRLHRRAIYLSQSSQNSP